MCCFDAFRNGNCACGEIVIILVAKLICRIVMCYQHLARRRIEESSYWVRLKQQSIVSFEGWPVGQTLPRYQNNGVSVDALWPPLDNPHCGQQVRLTISVQISGIWDNLTTRGATDAGTDPQAADIFKTTQQKQAPSCESKSETCQVRGTAFLLVGRERHVSTVTVTGLCLR